MVSWMMIPKDLAKVASPLDIYHFDIHKSYLDGPWD
jgi:hypothetical protein